MRYLLLIICTCLPFSAISEKEFTPPPGAIEYIYATALNQGEFNGKKIEKNPAEALVYLNKSAADGFPHAPFALCVHFKTKGEDLADVILMHEWCSIAAHIPGKTQQMAANNVSEAESFIGKIDEDSLKTIQTMASEAIERFCNINKEKQPSYGCQL